MTTGVPSGSCASACRVCSVACRQPALVGAPNVSCAEGRPWIARRSPPLQPEGSRGWFPESTTMQQPSLHLRPEIWSVTWKRPVGVGDPGAPIETRRRKTTRPSSRSVSSRFDRSASTAYRTVRSRTAAVRGTQPTTPFPSTSLSTANQLPRRPTTWSRLTEPKGVFQLATASVLLPGARRIGTFAFQPTTSAVPLGVDCPASPAGATSRPTAIVPAVASPRSARRVRAASDTDGRPAYRPSSLVAVLEDVVTPVGPYRLRLMARSGTWRGALPGNRLAAAHQRPDGRVVVHAPDEEALATARFMLALDDDTAPFHERFARDPLIGPAARAFVGYRPLRVATVTHAVVRALCGQLIEARRARAIEQAIARACGEAVVTQPALRRLAPVELRRFGLAQQRATVLARLAATLDLERLRDLPGDAVVARLARVRGIGPWSIGVISLEGLGRLDRGLVGDLSLVKLYAALTGRWVEGHETANLIAPYEEWQGLAGEILLLGWSRGLVRGASADRARIARRRERRAA
jgi:DNA-3-methyladenine glycosylase II